MKTKRDLTYRYIYGDHPPYGVDPDSIAIPAGTEITHTQYNSDDSIIGIAPDIGFVNILLADMVIETQHTP